MLRRRKDGSGSSGKGTNGDGDCKAGQPPHGEDKFVACKKCGHQNCVHVSAQPPTCSWCPSAAPLGRQAADAPSWPRHSALGAKSCRSAAKVCTSSLLLVRRQPATGLSLPRVVATGMQAAGEAPVKKRKGCCASRVWGWLILFFAVVGASDYFKVCRAIRPLQLAAVLPSSALAPTCLRGAASRGYWTRCSRLPRTSWMQPAAFARTSAVPPRRSLRSDSRLMAVRACGRIINVPVARGV